MQALRMDVTHLPKLRSVQAETAGSREPRYRGPCQLAYHEEPAWYWS